MIEPTVLRGFSDEYGSWKIICASRRNSISCLGLMSAISSPSNLIEPPVGSSSRSSRRPVVDLPQPDSPTRPSVSPRLMSNDTPSTARTAPRAVPYQTRRSRTERTASEVGTSGRLLIADPPLDLVDHVDREQL